MRFILTTIYDGQKNQRVIDKFTPLVKRAFSSFVNEIVNNKIRGLLAGTIPVEDIVHRDTESYFGILYKDNNRKPICRINLDTKNKQLLIPDESKKFERIYIDSLNDIYKYKNRLIEVAKRYL